jgi:cell wall-associated NlpC family hydrolase
MNAISLHSVIPVRVEPKESAEQSTQILFGDTCTIIEQIPRWNRVKLDLDGQEGWVDSKMITPMTKEEYASYATDYSKAAYVLYPIAYAVSANNSQTIPLTAGTRLAKYQNGQFQILGVNFRIDPSMVIQQPLALNEQNLMQAVRFFLNIPYLWGGKNALGMDCSGFTQTILGLFGKRILRNASEQATQGRKIATLQKAKAGDLAFFAYYNEEKKENKITHVGILLDAERVVHCSGRVKVEKIDNTGIFSVEQASNNHPNGQYTHQLLQIRRYL